MNNGKDPSHIVSADIVFGATEKYIMLRVTAEKPEVVHAKLRELKSQFGINSGPVQGPPGELETQLASALISLQAEFELMKTR